MMKNSLAVLLLASLAFTAHASPAASYFSGVTLRDQDNKTVDLYELMKGRTVVMNSFFASCTGACPVMTANFNAIQKEFAGRLGKDLVLICITVDPANDTPAALKAYAAKMKAGAGWYFLTGTPEQVQLALSKIGQYTEKREEHHNTIIIGNDRTGLWKKALGVATPAELVKIVDTVLNDRGTAATGSGASR